MGPFEGVVGYSSGKTGGGGSIGCRADGDEMIRWRGEGGRIHWRVGEAVSVGAELGTTSVVS